VEMGRDTGMEICPLERRTKPNGYKAWYKNGKYRIINEDGTSWKIEEK